MNIEYVRTPDEILIEAAAAGTPIERRLAIEVAAGDLAQALLRRRVRELERALSTSRADRMLADQQCESGS